MNNEESFRSVFIIPVKCYKLKKIFLNRNNVNYCLMINEYTVHERVRARYLSPAEKTLHHYCGIAGF